MFFSDLSYNTSQFALFGETTLSLTPRFSLTGGLRFYHFSEDKEQVFDGLFANDNTGYVAGVAAGFDRRERPGTARDRDLQVVRRRAT